MKENRTDLCREGEVVFLEWHGAALSEVDNLWELRQQTKTMLQQGETRKRYVVTEVVSFYPGAIHVILGDRNAMNRQLKSVTGDLAGEADGVYACVAFWDIHRGEGLLIHRQGGRWLFAVLPVLDEAVAEQEELAVAELVALSGRMKGIPIRLDRTLEQGRHMLSHLLDILAEQIDA